MKNGQEPFSHLMVRVFEMSDDGKLSARHSGADVRRLHPLIVAYIGDAYFHLFVRTRLLDYEQGSVEAVSRIGARIVSAVCQSHAYAEIEPMLTDDERDIFRRGRNSHSRTPKNSSVAEYHASTGFEALLGSLWLEKKFTRAEEIAEAAFNASVRMILSEPEK